MRFLIVFQAISSMPSPSNLPSAEPTAVGVLHAAREPVRFNPGESKPLASWTGVNAETALMTIVSSERIQEATGLDRQGLLRRFAQQWSADSALRECGLSASCSLYFRTNLVSQLLSDLRILNHSGVTASLLCSKYRRL
jgi:hypothetical protein